MDTDHNTQLHNTHSLDAQLTLPNTHLTQCVPYKGTVCSQYLKNHTLIIQRNGQNQLEEGLHRAFRFIANAAGISPQCHRFTMPLLCFQSFDVCEQNDFPSSLDYNMIPFSQTGNNHLLNRMQADHAVHHYSTNSAAYSSHYTSKQSPSFTLKQVFIKKKLSYV